MLKVTQSVHVCLEPEPRSLGLSLDILASNILSLDARIDL